MWCRTSCGMLKHPPPGRMTARKGFDMFSNCGHLTQLESPPVPGLPYPFAITQLRTDVAARCTPCLVRSDNSPLKKSVPEGLSNPLSPLFVACSSAARSGKPYPPLDLRPGLTRDGCMSPERPFFWNDALTLALTSRPYWLRRSMLASTTT